MIFSWLSAYCKNKVAFILKGKYERFSELTQTSLVFSKKCVYSALHDFSSRFEANPFFHQHYFNIFHLVNQKTCYHVLHILAEGADYLLTSGTCCENTVCNIFL